jgi:hypothetical protein
MTMSERKNSPATERIPQFVRTSLATFETINEIINFAMEGTR